jgi:hypothetical protein
MLMYSNQILAEFQKEVLNVEFDLPWNSNKNRNN